MSFSAFLLDQDENPYIIIRLLSLGLRICSDFQANSSVVTRWPPLPLAVWVPARRLFFKALSNRVAILIQTPGPMLTNGVVGFRFFSFPSFQGKHSVFVGIANLAFRAK